MSKNEVTRSRCMMRVGRNRTRAVQGAVCLALLLLMSIGGTGCVRHVVHRGAHGSHTVKHVTVLEGEHGSKQITLVHRRPHASRVCWKHAHHWHCRR